MVVVEVAVVAIVVVVAVVVVGSVVVLVQCSWQRGSVGAGGGGRHGGRGVVVRVVVTVKVGIRRPLNRKQEVISSFYYKCVFSGHKPRNPQVLIQTSLNLNPTDLNYPWYHEEVKPKSLPILFLQNLNISVFSMPTNPKYSSS